jgi:hypothetical protein
MVQACVLACLQAGLHDFQQVAGYTRHSIEFLEYLPSTTTRSVTSQSSLISTQDKVCFKVARYRNIAVPAMAFYITFYAVRKHNHLYSFMQLSMDLL